MENLVDFYLEYNEQHRLHDITVYSVWHPRVEHHPARQSEVNHYRYVKMGGWWNKLKKKVYQLTHGREYYHYTIEYFLHEALKDIRRQHYDIIILENRPGFALKLKAVTDAALVYHLHNDKLNATTARCQEVYDAAARIISVSDYITRRVKTINPQDTKCTTVHNGIDLQAFSGNSPSAIPASEKCFTLIFSGRLIPEKGILPLIQAMQLLKDEKAVRLWVLGGSSLGDKADVTPFMRQLQDAARGLDNVIFTGYVEYQQMMSYLHHADVAVLPSLWDEPFGLTCAEALAVGLPIITTLKGGIPEVVDDTCAILLDTDDRFVETLAEAILDLCHHPERRRQMGEAALRRSQRFSKQRYADDFFLSLTEW